MSHLVTMRQDPREPDFIYLCTDPGMASVMGGFGPARYVGNAPPVKDASYVIQRDDLPRFVVYCANRSVRILDRREAETSSARRDRPPWAERPLPECRECGQPRARYAQPDRCPQCGEPWVEVQR